MQVRVVRQLIGITSIAGLILGQTIFSWPVLAWTPLISGLAVDKKLSGEDKKQVHQDFYDPPNSPVITDIAEFLTQYLPENGFFFMGDQYTGHAGVDLRTLLLKQSTPIKLPDNYYVEELSLPGEDGAIPSIEAPGLSPSIKTAAKLNHDPGNANDGGDLKIAAPDFRAQTAPGYKESAKEAEALSVDTAPLLATGLPNLNTFPAIGTVVDKRLLSPLLASSMSDAVASELAPQLAAFLLWTMPMNGVSKFAMPSFSMDFAGTFVECEFGTRFKSIVARNLNLSKGRLLISVMGSPVIVGTDAGDVTVPPSTVAIIELTDTGLLKVTSLLAGPDAAVSLQLKNGSGKVETINLKPKQELIVSNSDLSSEDISTLSNATKFNIGAIYLAKGSVDLDTLSKHDLLFDLLKDKQKIPALTELKTRLSAQSSDKQESAPSPVK